MAVIPVSLKFQLIEACQRHMASKILVNIGLVNGLLFYNTKPLPEPVLIYHHLYIAAFI